ncbi:CUB domain-containing protein-like [Stylophora pistillata]|uniref:CUB domain-containing protein-like n=1 Tax=Stylophora pistillata TaxID=50429 RepID=UPI000C041869|nr:CUB domain-containing protein-like [Stylophora pistillata]
MLYHPSKTNTNAPTRLRCHVCLEPVSLENCTAAQTLQLCETGFRCYNLQAFDTAQNSYIFAKGCLPSILCAQNRGCDFLNLSRNGSIESCLFECCHTQGCNAQQSASSTTPPLPTTTEQPSTAVTIPVTPSGKCGGSLSASSGTLSSPNYPSKYPNNADCTWIMSVPQGSTLKIKFVNFYTERRYDYVKIYLDRRLLRRLTGSLRKRDKTISIKGTGKIIRVIFKSDRSVTKRGFFAQYNVMLARSCGGTLPGSSGNFKSPNYPASYPNDVQCKWTLHVPRGAVLRLDFRTFETERCDDYVKIYRGRRLIRRLTGRYGRYGRYRGGNDRRSVFQNDDDCDDDDDNGDDDDDDDDEDDDDYNDDINDDDRNILHENLDDAVSFSKRKYGRYNRVRRARNRYGSRVRNRKGSQIKGHQRFSFVDRVTVRGTGEKISIIFKADRRNTGKGFYTTYFVSKAHSGR